MILQYNSNGEGIPGIPACDLDDGELSRLQEVLVISRDALITQLTSRGLYSLPAQPRASKKLVEPEIQAPLTDEK